jgi:hypothetical protein
MAHWLSCWVGLQGAGLSVRQRQGAKQLLQVAGYIFAMTADGLVWKPYEAAEYRGLFPVSIMS